jgi:hypothetical protein
MLQRNEKAASHVRDNMKGQYRGCEYNPLRLRQLGREPPMRFHRVMLQATRGLTMRRTTREPEKRTTCLPRGETCTLNKGVDHREDNDDATDLEARVD